MFGALVGSLSGGDNATPPRISSGVAVEGTAEKTVGLGTEYGSFASYEEAVASIANTFIEDKENINSGLPILSWQTNNDELNLINTNNAFVEDTNNINKGYPLLAWQAE